MATEIVIDLGGSIARMEDIERNLRDLGPLYAEITEIMLSDISQHFEDEKGPDGPWEDLAPSTKEQRRKKGHWPGKKLQVQSRGSGLLGSLQPMHDNESAAVTTNKIYAAIHHLGGPAGRGKKVNIPARPFMYLSTDAEDEIRDAAEFHILK
ncbi:MAG: phage virion morphogenesis protein [Balneolales bacterium]